MKQDTDEFTWLEGVELRARCRELAFGLAEWDKNVAYNESREKRIRALEAALRWVVNADKEGLPAAMMHAVDVLGVDSFPSHLRVTE